MGIVVAFADLSMRRTFERGPQQGPCLVFARLLALMEPLKRYFRRSIESVSTVHSK